MEGGKDGGREGGREGAKDLALIFCNEKQSNRMITSLCIFAE